MSKAIFYIIGACVYGAGSGLWVLYSGQPPPAWLLIGAAVLFGLAVEFGVNRKKSTEQTQEQDSNSE